MKTVIRLATALWLAAMLCDCLALWRCLLRGAPAPLPKRAAKKGPSVPTACVMRWCGVRYDARFWPDGRYSAPRLDYPEWPAFAGSWKLEGRTLVITETDTPHDEWSWRTYRIGMDDRLRAGAIEGGGDVVLEE